jgi:SAM-dependent methyltransferase
MISPSANYQLDPLHRVWRRPGHTDFSYSDGDEVENRIASIIQNAKDLSVLSTELQAQISDWPSNYHLSSQRANLLRPLKDVLSGSILEIGSGCGAITRFLGETARSVVALEGSHRRAEITRARTRDLANVDVFCDEFSAFETNQRFDVVTLIGVLEYANMFVGGPTAALSMLEKARSHLTENGVLVIAIENQLGLKYFAGAPEDHLGKAMLGVENQYLADGVRTYSKDELSDLLQASGFAQSDFFYPLPDYKMPTSILSDPGTRNPNFNILPFLRSTAGKDPQLALEPTFCLERTWAAISNNGLTATFSNSFLIVAGATATATAASDPQRLAWHYSTRRQPQYCKETVFSVAASSNEVGIERNKLSDLQGASGADPTYRQAVDLSDRYSSSPLLSDHLIDLITRNNWTFEELGGFLLDYAARVARIAKLPLVANGRISWEYRVPGSMFDCIPQNIAVHSAHTEDAFDLEWHSDESLSFTRLAFRGLWSALGELTLIGKPHAAIRVSLLDVIQGAMANAGKQLSHKEAHDLVLKELAFQAAVSGRAANVDEVWSWLKEGSLRTHNTQSALSEAKQTLVALNHHIEANADALTDHKKHIANLENKVRHIEDELATSRSIAEAAETRAKADAANEAIWYRTTIYNLAQQSALQNIQGTSPKHLVKRMRDYRNFRHASQSPGPASPIEMAVVLASATLNHWSARPSLIAFANLQYAGQSAHLIQQSCQWPLPFHWAFCATTETLLQKASEACQQLGLPVKTSLEARDPDARLWPSAIELEQGALLAIPKLVREPSEQAATAWPMPDAEMVRQAYSALICDQRLAAIYVREPKRSTGSLHEQYSAMCILRAKDIALVPKGTWSDQQCSQAMMRQETQSMSAWAADTGRFILVI